MKRLATTLLAMLLLVACSAQRESPTPGADTPPATVCTAGSDRLSLAGVNLLDPPAPLLRKLGEADHMAHSAKYPMLSYQYGFGSVTVWGDGRIFSLDVKAVPGAHPLGSLWSGVNFGDNRERVLQALAKLGYCPASSTANTVEFVRSEERLTLTFGAGGALERAFLVLEKPPGNPASAPSRFYPPDVRTGLPAIDQVIQAAATKESETLAGLLKLSQLACTTQVYGMPGKPICPAGTAEGTLVEVFPSGSCEPNFIYGKEQAGQIFRTRFTEPYYVYAVFRLEGESTARYGVILGTGAEGVGTTLYLDAQGSIVQVVSCGDVANMIPQGANFILAPRDAQLG